MEFHNAECDKCGEEYDARRKALGYNTCLSCGQLLAEQVKFCVAPVHKSNYVVVRRYEKTKEMHVAEEPS